MKAKVTLTKSDFWPAGNVTPIALTWVELGRYVVPVQQKLSPGWGMSEDQQGSPARIIIDLNSAGPAAAVGMIRVIAMDSAEFRKTLVLEDRSENLKLGTADPTLAVPFPKKPNCKLRPNSILMIEFRSDTLVAAITEADSTIRMTCTRYV